jgi:hypothetical protein
MYEIASYLQENDTITVYYTVWNNIIGG